MREAVLIIDIAHSSSQQETPRTLQDALFPYQAFTLPEIGEAIEWVQSGKAPKPDAVLFDMHVHGQKETVAVGIRSLKTVYPDLPVIVLVAYGDEESSVQVIQAGAFDCLSKPVTTERLRIALNNALKFQRMSQYIAWLERNMAARPDGQDAGGTDPMLIDGQQKVKTLKSIQEEAIRVALEQADGCMTRAARSLGIGRSTLYRKVNEFAIDGYISRENQTTRPIIKISSTGRS